MSNIKRWIEDKVSKLTNIDREEDLKIFMKMINISEVMDIKIV